MSSKDRLRAETVEDLKALEEYPAPNSLDSVRSLAHWPIRKGMAIRIKKIKRGQHARVQRTR